MSMKEIADSIKSIHFIGTFNQANFFSLMERVFRRFLECDVITKEQFETYMDFIFKEQYPDIEVIDNEDGSTTFKSKKQQ